MMHKSRSRNAGFTIVELIIVVVVIAILATITAIAFTGVQKKTVESILQSDLSSAVKQLEVDKIKDGNALYPATLDAARGGQGIQSSSNTAYEYSYDSLTNTYCLSVTSTKAGAAGYHMLSTSKVVLDGVCDGHLPPGGVVAKVWTKISAGNEYACGIANGEAYCWGSNGNGQLGDGTTTQRNTPVKVTQAAGLLAGKVVTDISAGGYHTCAIADGIAYCWGNGSGGKIGDNAATNRSEPVEVTRASGFLLGKTVTKISAGNSHTCAIALDELYCWGTNSNGQLGDGTTTQRNTPVKVTQASGLLLGKIATDVSGGGNPYTCAVASGEAFCWGFNGSGILGDNTTTQRVNPIRVTQTSGLLLGKTATNITASQGNTCVIASAEAYCWGYGGQGQNGNSSAANSSVPVKVTQASGMLLGKTATMVTAGSNIVCGAASGEAFCWGSSVYGSLGAGPSVSSTAAPVKVISDVGLLAGKTVTVIDSSNGQDATCVVASGVPYCWGKNTYGQLGNNSTTDSNVPVPVTY